MNTRKSAVYLCLVFFMFLLLSACGNQPQVSDSGKDSSQEAETSQSNAGTNESKNSDQAPTETEIQSLLDNGEVKVFWAVEETAFSQSAAVSIYKAETLNGDAVWDALFSQDDLISRQRLDGSSKMTITLDGAEYVGQLYNSGMIEFSGLSEAPTRLSPEHLMGTLSNFTDMNWTLGKPDDANDTSTYYQFVVDGIIIDRKGYSVGAEVYNGPFAAFSPSYVSISVPFRLGAKGDTLDASGFISAEQAEALCNADLLAQTDYPMVVVFDHAELVYYYQAQQQMLLPAWRITGSFYTSGDGSLLSNTTTRLIDAQTGELFW